MPWAGIRSTTLTAAVTAVVIAGAALLACGNAGPTDGAPVPGDDAGAITPGSSGGVTPQSTTDGGADAGPRKPPPDLPPGAGFTCEVQTFLATKCQVCHEDPPQGGALVPLKTVAQLLDWSKLDPSKSVAQVVLERIQDAKAPMPPAFFNNPVTPDEIQAFEAWMSGNYQGSCAGSVPPAATCTTCHGDKDRVGIAGADPSLPISPPRGSKGETATTMRAVGAHQAHVNRADLMSAPLGCTDCHVMPTVMTHSNGVVDMVFGAMAKSAGANPTWNGTSCGSTYCHGNFPGGRTVFAPSWTGGAMSCGSCHGTPPATPPHSNPTLECSLCHGPGYSTTAKTVNKALHLNGVVNTDQSALSCTSCHGDNARAGIAGTDPQLKASPPLGSKGETATTMRAVGAHQAHVNKADLINAPLACADCHVVPTSNAHSNGVVEIAFGAMAKSMGAVPVWNGATCASSYCHGNFPGGRTVFAPSWTGGAMSCGSCHGTPPATPPHSNPALECSTCHGAGYSATAKTVNKATHIDGVVNVSSSSLTCSSCHGDGARVAVAGADPQVKASPPLGSKGETATSARAVGAHQAHVNKGALSAPVACNECHVVPITNSHSDGTVQIAFGTLAKTKGAAPAWNGTSCSASYCHGNFPGGATTAAPAWTGGAMACNSCHGTPPATPPHGNPALECSTCHGPGYSATAQTVNKTTHINGVVNVDQGALSCSACHGDGARAGIAGSDPQVKASPPVGTKGETATSARAVGAHQAHVNKSVLSAPVACNECHVVPITSSHSNGTVQIAFGTLARAKGAAPAWNGTTCASSYCHGNFPGGRTLFAPTWTGGAMACGSCHATPPATPPHGNPALECSVCHGAGYSATAQTVNKATHINGVVNVDQGALTCTSCHGDPARVGIPGADSRLTVAPPLGTKGETATTTRAVGAHQAHLNKATFADTPVGCSDCHAVPSSNSHSDGVAQVNFGAFAKTGGAVPTWNGTTCSNVYCHGEFTGGSTLFNPTWTGGALTCGSCHAIAPSTGDHNKHVNDKKIPCSDCHGAGYAGTATTKTVNKTLHINGVKDVAGPKMTSYNKGTRLCVSTCHKNETW